MRIGRKNDAGSCFERRPCYGAEKKLNAIGISAIAAFVSVCARRRMNDTIAARHHMINQFTFTNAAVFLIFFLVFAPMFTVNAFIWFLVLVFSFQTLTMTCFTFHTAQIK